MVGPQPIAPDGMDFLLQPEQGGGNGNLFVPLERGPRPALPDNPRAHAAIPPLFIDGLEPFDLGDQVAAQMPGPGRDVPRPAPPPPLNVDAAHRAFLGSAEDFRRYVNTSNTVGHAPRAIAEATLRTLSLFQWDGTGISQHHNWQTDVAARRNVIAPPMGADGRLDVGPTQWAALYNDVQGRTDQLNRRWANCAEQAGSVAHLIHQRILSDPSMAGVQVRTAYQNGHSWAEVRFPNGQSFFYDPWRMQTGPIGANDRPGVQYSRWHGR